MATKKSISSAKIANDDRPIVLNDAAMAINVLSLLQQFYMREDEGDGFPGHAVAGMYFLLGAVSDVLEREAAHV